MEQKHEYISWEEAFMGLAKLVALKSKIVGDQRGCVIVDKNNRIMSLGFNGIPTGCNDSLFLNNPKLMPYIVLPAAVGAIISARRNLEGCKIYMTHYPDCEETKMILQSGITEVNFLNVDVADDNYKSSTKMLTEAKAKIIKLENINVSCINKRQLTWNELFVGAGKLLSMRSKDPNTQVGSCIADKENHIISLGYNGLPKGCDDKNCPWHKRDSQLPPSETKYPYSMHSEANAITIALSHGISLKNCRIYVTLFPCNDCTNKIIQSGISDIYYVSDKYATTPAVIAAKQLLDNVGIKYQQVDDVTVDLETRGRQFTR